MNWDSVVNNELTKYIEQAELYLSTDSCRGAKGKSDLIKANW